MRITSVNSDVSSFKNCVFYHCDVWWAIACCPFVLKLMLPFWLTQICVLSNILSTLSFKLLCLFMWRSIFLENNLCFALYVPWQPLYQWVNSYDESFGVQFCYTSSNCIFSGYQWVNSCDESLGLQLCYTSISCFFSVHLLLFLRMLFTMARIFLARFIKHLHFINFHVLFLVFITYLLS